MRERYELDAAAFEDLDRLYRGLADSGAFLYAFVDVRGAFLFMNRGMQIFLGRDPEGGAPVSLLSRCPLGQIETMRGLLRDAMKEPVAAVVPLARPDGTGIWMDTEFSAMDVRGEPALQVVGVDVTEWVNLREQPEDGWERGEWSRVLDCCPGLLCCVVDREGTLIYASQGYSALALRVLGHRCEVGAHYPPLRSETDKSLHDVLAAAALGQTSGVEIEERHSEGDRLWSFTAAPLERNGGLAGVVVRVLPVQVPQLRQPAQPSDAPEPPTPAAEPPVEPSERAGILNAFAVPAAVVNERGVCLAANAPFILALDAREKVVGCRLLGLIPRDGPPNEDFHEKFPSVLQAREGRLSCRLSSRDGDLTWLEVSVRPLEWAGFRAALLTCEDVTLLRRTQEQLQRAAVTDRSTGVLNRQGMERVLSREMERAVRDKTPLSLMIMDIDGFRRLNESRGYVAAELILKTLIALCQGLLAVEDVIGRWGGDEFMVLTPRSSEAARLLADSMRDVAHSSSLGVEGALTLSVGIAQFRAEMDLSSLVGAAYDAMVRAKRNGGNRAVTAEDGEGR